MVISQDLVFLAHHVSLLVCAEKELSKTKKELVRVEGEKKSLLEDILEIREAKKQVEKATREQRKRLEVLEREVQFYREQSTQAISERDNMTWEIENQKKEISELKEDVSSLKIECDEVKSERDVLKQRLKEANDNVLSLEKAAAKAESIPSLEQEISKLKNKTVSMEKDIAGLIKDRDTYQAAQKKLGQELDAAVTGHAKELKAKEDDMRHDVEDKVRQIEELKEELGAVTEQKVSALVKQSEAESLLSSARRDVDRLKLRVNSLEEKLATATEEKVKALMQAAELSAEAQGATSKNSSRNATPISSPVKTRLATPRKI